MPTPPSRRILLTGATGYVGGRLLPRLEQLGHRVRCLARQPRRLTGRVEPQTEIVAGDVLQLETLHGALEGVDTAFYLIRESGELDRAAERAEVAATNFASAAAAAGVRRIVYLGRLGHGDHPSADLQSRHEVGRILAASPIETIELRCADVIGSGSLSFEAVRALVNRLPVMFVPSWTRLPTQPIAVEDVIDYLLHAVDLAPGNNRLLEIGSPDIVCFADLLREYAAQRGLHRLWIPVPWFSHRVSSRWLGLVTPLYAPVARKLIDNARNATLVVDTAARAAFPIRPRTMREAIRRAIAFEDNQFAATRWSDALSSHRSRRHYGGVRFGSRLLDARSRYVAADPDAAFRPIQRIGGTNGWYFANWLWRLRGLLDLLVGGPGMRRGRPHPEELHVGDAVDWWRVEEIEAGRLLRLEAELKLPGRAWLQFEVRPEAGGARIFQTAIFDPIGLGGLAYWYVVFPLHVLVFRGMVRNIARHAARAGLGGQARERPHDLDESRPATRHRSG